VKRQTFESHLRSTTNKVWQKQKAGWLSTGRRSFPIVALLVCIYFTLKWYLYDDSPPWVTKPIPSNKTVGYSESTSLQEAPSSSTAENAAVNNGLEDVPSSSVRAASTSEMIIQVDAPSSSTAESATACPSENTPIHDSQRPSSTEGYSGSTREKISMKSVPSSSTTAGAAKCHSPKIDL